MEGTSLRERRTEWRDLSHGERRKYAIAYRRLNLGIWGYSVTSLRSVHLTTKEGYDNSPFNFAKDLRTLVESFRKDGYVLEYNGALEYTPGKHLLHWHGIFRIKGGYFVQPMMTWEGRAKVRRELGDRWNSIHGAFRVAIDSVGSHYDLKRYILKHIIKEYIGVDEDIRNKFLFSRGWMRSGWKDIEGLAKLWVLGGTEEDGGLSALFMDKKMWSRVNEIMQAWAERKTVMFDGEITGAIQSGYLYMELGRIREAFGSGFFIYRDGEISRSRFEYVDF